MFTSPEAKQFNKKWTNTPYISTSVGKVPQIFQTTSGNNIIICPRFSTAKYHTPLRNYLLFSSKSFTILNLIHWFHRLHLTIFFIVVLFRRGQGYGVHCLLQVLYRLGVISFGRLAENRGYQIAVVPGEHEEHPQEKHQTHRAGVHDHACSRSWRVSPFVTPRLYRSASLESLRPPPDRFCSSIERHVPVSRFRPLTLGSYTYSVPRAVINRSAISRLNSTTNDSGCIRREL